MNYIKYNSGGTLAMSFKDDLALNRFDLKLKKVSSFKGLLLRLLEVMENNKDNKTLTNLLTGYLIMQMSLSNLTNMRISIFGSIAPILVAIRNKYSLSDINKLIKMLITETSDIDIYYNGNYTILFDELSNMQVDLKADEIEDEPSLVNICLSREVILNKCKLTFDLDEWFDTLNPLVSDLLIDNPKILSYLEEYKPIYIDIVSLKEGVEFMTLYQTPRLSIFSINFRPCTVFARGDILEYKSKEERLTLNIMQTSIKAQAKFDKMKDLVLLKRVPARYKHYMYDKYSHTNAWDCHLRMLIDENLVVKPDKIFSIGTKYSTIKSNPKKFFDLMREYWGLKHERLSSVFMLNKNRIKNLSRNIKNFGCKCSIEEVYMDTCMDSDETEAKCSNCGKSREEHKSRDNQKLKLRLLSKINNGIKELYRKHIFLPSIDTKSNRDRRYCLKTCKDSMIDKWMNATNPITLEPFDPDQPVVVYGCGHLNVVDKRHGTYLAIMENKLRNLNTQSFPTGLNCPFCRGCGMLGWSALEPEVRFQKSFTEESSYTDKPDGIGVDLHTTGFYFPGIEYFDKYFLNLKDKMSIV